MEAHWATLSLFHNSGLQLTEDYSLKLNFTNAVIDVDGGERLGSWSASP